MNPVINGVERLYRLRWVYEYFDGKPDRIGCWDLHDVSNEAWNTTKSGLSVCYIEGQSHLGKKENRKFAECRGQDLVNVEWQFAASVPAMYKGTLRPNSHTVGMNLITRYFRTQILIDGTVRVRKRTEDELKMQLATF